LVTLLCLILAPVLSWWSGQAFVVSDYRAGCTGLCAGHRGAPLAVYAGESAGGQFLPAMFALNSLIYLVVLLSWSVLLRAVIFRAGVASHTQSWAQAALLLLLIVVPLALTPIYLPPPEAHVRGDPQRIAINARREVCMYNQLADLPVLRVALEDVRPRHDGQPGMRVCLRIYSLFFWPAGFMFMDMTPEGVHSTAGGVLPRTASCWE
jgi:hypothetical protein